MMQFYHQKKVLVTGATGLLGSNLVNFLMKSGETQVIALSRSKNKLCEGFTEHLSNSLFSYIPCDVSQDFSLPDGIDIIFHAAGPMGQKKITEQPVDVILPNLLGTLRCLEYMRRQNELYQKTCRLVLFSSVTVYGNHSLQEKTVKEQNTYETADALDQPRACYSESKRMAEVIARSYQRQYGIDFVAARLSTVYGNTKFIPDTAFYEFIRKSIQRENITLKTSSCARRDNIYIDDAVNGLLHIGAYGINGQSYNVSSNGEKGNYLAIDEIAQVIIDVSNDMFKGRPIKLITENTIKKLPGLKLDNSLLKTLGWKLQFNFKDAVQNIIRQQLSQKL